MRSQLSGLALLGLLAGCVDLPFERSNYLDPGSGAQLVIEGVPDSIFAVGQSFSMTVRLDPGPPSTATLPTIVLEYPERLLRRVDPTTYVTTIEMGYVPVRVTYRARLEGVLNGPRGERSLMLQQRPVSLTLQCLSSEGCASITGTGNVRQLAFRANDSGGTAVAFPSSNFRYGEVFSRDPSRVQVLGRPAANAIDVRSVSPGRTWIVMTGEPGLVDSLSIEVLP